jgi:hypothetical protein
MKPLALTDLQLAEVRAAAVTLLPSERPEFLRGLASRLGSEPSDEAVALAIAAQLAVNKLPIFLCDGIKEQTPRTSK